MIIPPVWQGDVTGLRYACLHYYSVNRVTRDEDSQPLNTWSPLVTSLHKWPWRFLYSQFTVDPHTAVDQSHCHPRSLLSNPVITDCDGCIFDVTNGVSTAWWCLFCDVTVIISPLSGIPMWRHVWRQFHVTSSQWYPGNPLITPYHVMMVVIVVIRE